jgi:type VI protein secretion system component Hcp
MSQGDCFLKIVASKSGVVKGESADPDFPGYIQLLSWSWGAQTTTGGNGKSRAQSQALSFTCNTDSSYAALISILITNDEIKTATLQMRRSGGPKSQNYLTKTFKKAKLESINVGFNDTQLIPVASISMSFEEIEVEYRPQAEHGGSAGGASRINWQISDR